MKTVNEVSKLTGISVRALHYYDEIGLLKPTTSTEAGYRLYDDKALEKLQQILFFREFDIPLAVIRDLMDNPAFDRRSTLQSQKELLISKRERLDRLVGLLDEVLKGENTMSFQEFSKKEVEEFYNRLMDTLQDGQKKALMKDYENEAQFKETVIKNLGSEQGQENLKKMIEWYGSLEDAANGAGGQASPEMIASFQNRIDGIYRKLAGMKGEDVHSFRVKELIGEYDFVMKMLFHMKDAAPMLCDLADSFIHDEAMKEANDGQYGEGSSEYIGKAILAFYEKA